jgi:hypothetical protein
MRQWCVWGGSGRCGCAEILGERMALLNIRVALASTG